MIEYEEEWLVNILFKLDGSVGFRAMVFALPTGILCLSLVVVRDYWDDLDPNLGLMDANIGQMWSVLSAVLLWLLGMRTNRAMSRFWEGTGLLHQMRGEWFDSVSCCVTFSRSARHQRPEEVEQFRHTIVRLMSLCHASALEEISGNEDKCELIDPYGLDEVTLLHLRECAEDHQFNKVEVVLHLVQSLITKCHDDGVLKIPPPILSRVYQTLSRGFVNLLNAKKITDTRFPFPYAQLISWGIFIQIGLLPLIISHQFVETAWKYLWAPLAAFVPMFGMAALNALAIELENPFGQDPNDLPLHHFQADMNLCLLMLLHDNADLIPGLSGRAILDFREMESTLRLSPVRDENREDIWSVDKRRYSERELDFDPDESENLHNAGRRMSLGSSCSDDIAPDFMKMDSSKSLLTEAADQKSFTKPPPPVAFTWKPGKIDPSGTAPILDTAEVEEEIANGKDSAGEEIMCLVDDFLAANTDSAPSKAFVPAPMTGKRKLFGDLKPSVHFASDSEVNGTARPPHVRAAFSPSTDAPDQTDLPGAVQPAPRRPDRRNNSLPIREIGGRRMSAGMLLGVRPIRSDPADRQGQPGSNPGSNAGSNPGSDGGSRNSSKQPPPFY